MKSIGLWIVCLVTAVTLGGCCCCGCPSPPPPYSNGNPYECGSGYFWGIGYTCEKYGFCRRPCPDCNDCR